MAAPPTTASPPQTRVAPPPPVSANLPATDAAHINMQLLSPDTPLGASPIQARTIALIERLVATRPQSSVSVWQPRPHPLARCTSRLKRFNSAFLSLCDAVAFKDDIISSIFVFYPLCLSIETAEQVHATNARLLRMSDALHTTDVGYLSDMVCHISRLGRRTSVYFEIFAIRDGNAALQEYVVLETPPEASLPAPRASLAASPVPREVSIAAPSAPDSAHVDSVVRGSQRGQYTWQLTRERDQRRRLVWCQYDKYEAGKQAAEPKPFVCQHCGTTKTIQRRCALSRHDRCSECDVCVRVQWYSWRVLSVRI